MPNLAILVEITSNKQRVTNNFASYEDFKIYILNGMHTNKLGVIEAIGFYLEKAGYKDSQIKLLNKFAIKYDFYLTHQMKEPKITALNIPSVLINTC